MTTMYLADETTGECRGVYVGETAPTGTIDTEVPFTDGRQVWNGTAWEMLSAVLAEEERAWRDSELARTDFTQLPDAPLTTQEISDFATYRQELRDMPQLSGFPTTHTRPVSP